MWKRILNRKISKFIFKRTYVTHKNPFQRTIECITSDIKYGIFNKAADKVYPEHADVVIIGGGFLGSSGAYWLKERAGEGLNVVVLDKNLGNLVEEKESMRVLSHHYSLPENILLSQCSLDFMRNARRNLNLKDDIKYYPHGYLVLAGEKYAEVLEKNVSILREFGIKNELLSAEQLRKKYPWINTSDVKLGSLSTEGEGVYDCQALQRGMIKKSVELGANYVNGEVVGFIMEDQKDVLMEGVKPMSFQKLNKVVYKTKDNEERSIKFAICVLAAASESSNIAKLANIGSHTGLLSVPLPIEQSLSNVYSIENTGSQSQNIGISSPLVMDTTGLWLRRNGLNNNLLCGQIPLQSDKHLSENDNYELLLKPSLQNRFHNLLDGKVTHKETEVFDCNTYDDSGILGPHPYYTNLILAAGFGRSGIQHAPGIGKAISDLVIDFQYTNIDLTRFGFDRILMHKPIVDFNIY
ncbi:unnamed protein product [Leptosia nina]|uniref:FAD dependent oxidoreductase domain-containing protein n=1 Tax=Leptosia nina TaxID=320188 RepID=A0AAV1JKE3_9NEOP